MQRSNISSKTTRSLKPAACTGAGEVDKREKTLSHSYAVHFFSNLFYMNSITAQRLHSRNSHSQTIPFFAQRRDKVLHWYHFTLGNPFEDPPGTKPHRLDG